MLILDLFSVVDTLRLADGTLWSMPITLDVSSEDIHSKSITPGSRLTLRDPRDDQALAIITGMRIFQPILSKVLTTVFSRGCLPTRSSPRSDQSFRR
jgi:sulfate adenylyltransferase